MAIGERESLSIGEVEAYVHRFLHLQWCRDHPVACALLSVSAVITIGVVITFFRPLDGRHLAGR